MYDIQELINGVVQQVVATGLTMTEAQTKLNQLQVQAAVTNQQRELEGLPPITYKIVAA